MKKHKKKHRVEITVADPTMDRLRSLQLDYGRFERELEIDKHHLDDALVVQPKLIAEVGDIYGEVISIRDGLKDEVARAEARANLDIRHRSTEKTTEPQVKAEALLDKGRRKALAKYITACGEAERWESMVNAFKDRGFALRTLCEMWAFGYFATSSGKSRYSSDVQDDAIKRRREAIKLKREKLNQRRMRRRE